MTYEALLKHLGRNRKVYYNDFQSYIRDKVENIKYHKCRLRGKVVIVDKDKVIVETEKCLEDEHGDYTILHPSSIYRICKM